MEARHKSLRVLRDLEAGSAAPRAMGEEAVHLMQSDAADVQIDFQGESEKAEGSEPTETRSRSLQRSDTALYLGDRLETLMQESVAKLKQVELFSEEWEDELMRQKDEVEKEAKMQCGLISDGMAWEDIMQTFVKECLLHSHCEYEMMQRAELLIDQDWLATTDEVPGNIYRMAAFGEFDRAYTTVVTQGKRPAAAFQDASDGTVAPGDASARGITSRNASTRSTTVRTQSSRRNRDKAFTSSQFAAIARLAGFFAIFVIQLIGPPLIFASVLPEGYAAGVKVEEMYQWNLLHEKPWSEEILQEWRIHHLTKLLGVLFMFAFILNASYVAYHDMCAFHKIYDIFLYLNRSTPSFDLKGNKWLLMGALVNNWVILWCCVDAFFVIGASQTPKELLLDALGIIFLYNLDDIAGDFRFVDDDDWPGLRLGWISDEMVEAGYKLRYVEERQHAEKMEKWKDACMKDIGRRVYIFTVIATGVLSLILPLIACFTPFAVIAPGD